MCLLGLLLGRHVTCVLHLRDERLSRPVLEPDASSPVLSGTDCVSGGTWMGFNRASGVLVAVTNVRCKLAEPAGTQQQQQPRVSRGLLVAALLQGSSSAPSLQQLRSAAAGSASLQLPAAYSPFNLLVLHTAAAAEQSSSGEPGNAYAYSFA